MHPIIGAHGPHTEELRLIRRQQKELTQLFAHGVGYRLSVDLSGARLCKAGLGRDSSRGLRRRSHREFTPRAYALFCLTVAALARSKTQLLVDEMVSQIRSAAVDAELDIDLDAASDRRALHAALTALLDLGVLRERDGDLEHWVEQRTQSLLDVRRDLLAQLVSAPLSSSASPDDLLDQAGRSSRPSCPSKTSRPSRPSGGRATATASGSGSTTASVSSWSCAPRAPSGSTPRTG